MVRLSLLWFLKRIYRLIIRLPRLLYWLLLELSYRIGVKDDRKIPIIINNFNRVDYLRQLISSLKNLGYQNIIVLDNDSTYPPLLKYYSDSGLQVIMLGKNYGHLALWKSGLYKKYRWDYFCYTDSDVLPISECPDDFIGYFRKMISKYLSLDKVGFAIKIDDLPDSFSLKEKVVTYESQYWIHSIEPGVFGAPIDTTFALYRPLSNLRLNEVYTLPAARVDFPFLIRHLPWYVDSENLSEEEDYYIRNSNASSSVAKSLKGTGDVY